MPRQQKAPAEACQQIHASKSAPAEARQQMRASRRVTCLCTKANSQLLTAYFASTLHPTFLCGLRKLLESSCKGSWHMRGRKNHLIRRPRKQVTSTSALRNKQYDKSRQSMRAMLQRTRSELSTLCHRHEVFNSRLTRCNVARIFCHDLSPASHCTRRKLIPDTLKIQCWTCNLVTIEVLLQSLGNNYTGQ